MFIVSPSSSLLLLIHHFHFTLMSLSYGDLFRVRYLLCIFFFTHLIISSIYFIYLFIDIIFTLGTLRSMTHELFCTCCILYMRAWVLIIEYLGLVSFHFYFPITLAYFTSRVLRPLWGHGIKCHLRQPLLWQVFEFGLYLDVIMPFFLGDASLMFGPNSVVDMDDWDCTFDYGWYDFIWFSNLPYI